MPKSVYEDAAKQAEADIPAKEAEIAELQQRLQAATQELNYLRNIAAFGKHTIPTFVSTPPATGGGVVSLGMPQPAIASYAAKPQTIDYIRAVLKEGPLTAKQIKREIERKFHLTVGASTIYYNLDKGRKDGIFEDAGNEQWKLIEKKR